jgi:hypothetical protein
MSVLSDSSRNNTAAPPATLITIHGPHADTSLQVSWLPMRIQESFTFKEMADNTTVVAKVVGLV